MTSNTSRNSDIHAFKLPNSSSSRSPCPALNAAASHGYLPHSGRDISFMQLFNAIRTLYNLSLPLALFLACAGFFFCGHNGRPAIPFLDKIDLHDFARHGRIEHDGSLAHADAEPGAVFAPTIPDQELLKDLLNESEKGRDLDIRDLAKVRSKRDALLTFQGRELDWVHAEVTRGEAALILSIIGDGTKIPPQRLKQWMGEDRLPDGWTRPEKTWGLLQTIMMARKFELAVQEVNTGKYAGNSKEDDKKD